MNNAQRKQIEAIKAILDEQIAELETLRDAEQEKFDNLSDGLQMSEKGQRLEEVIAELEEAIENIEAASGNLNSASE